MATLEKFKSVFHDSDKVDELVEYLGYSDLIPLLLKFKGLEKYEADEFNVKYRRSSSKERLIQAIALIVEKDSLISYKALSQVVQFKNKSIWTKLFPFAEGMHKELVIQPVQQQQVRVQTAARQPSILWFCADEAIFKVAAGERARGLPLHSTPNGSLEYYELPSTSDYGNTVWLFRPSSKLSDVKIQRLFQYYNEMNYCIFTAACTPKNQPHCQDGDICVVNRHRPCSTGFVSELCHMTSCWELSTGSKWQCLGESSKVVFGKVGGSVSDNDCDFISEEAMIFCASAEEAWKKGTAVPHAAILAATQDRGSCVGGCHKSYVSHAVEYSYQVIEYLIEKLTILQCREGRKSS